MSDLIMRARAWIADDPDPKTREELQSLIDGENTAELESRMDTRLTFGTAGIRGRVGAGPGRMNRAVVIRATHGLAGYLGETDRPVVVGFDARPTSREFAEDTAGVLAAAGIPVLFFEDFSPTPLVAYAAKHLGAGAAVVVTASHNPPADNGYKVYGANAAQIVPPVDAMVQEGIEAAPGASHVARIEGIFDDPGELAQPVPANLVDHYWEELSGTRSRDDGSELDIVYTPIHGVGGNTFFGVMGRAGHTRITAVPEQAEPDGTFPTVDFPNPEEPGALDLALALASDRAADLVIANDPDADRLAVVIPYGGEWRPLSGNEIGVLLGHYMLSADGDPASAVVASSIVSSPMLGRIAQHFGARYETTLTGFKWIMNAALTLASEDQGRFVFGFEEALGYSVGSIVRDKDGISAAVLFADLCADLADSGESIMDRLHDLWGEHGLWVSAQTSLVRPGRDGMDKLASAIERLADDPPSRVGAETIVRFTDYRKHAGERPPWLGEQALVEFSLDSGGRILVRPSGTEPKLKIYVDLVDTAGSDPDTQHEELTGKAKDLGETLAESLGV